VPLNATLVLLVHGFATGFVGGFDFLGLLPVPAA